MPADTRQRIRALLICLSWLSAVQSLSSFAGWMGPCEYLTDFQPCCSSFTPAGLGGAPVFHSGRQIFKGQRARNKLGFEVSQEGFENKGSNSIVSRKTLVPSGESFLPELFPEAVQTLHFASSKCIRRGIKFHMCCTLM